MVAFCSYVSLGHSEWKEVKDLCILVTVDSTGVISLTSFVSSPWAVASAEVVSSTLAAPKIEVVEITSVD